MQNRQTIKPVILIPLKSLTSKTNFYLNDMKIAFIIIIKISDIIKTSFWLRQELKKANVRAFVRSFVSDLSTAVNLHLSGSGLFDGGLSSLL